ncbi:MAG TPA: hypothetical protein VE733_26685 [Streptosporangiaceae bacterium]|jgi:hypothetical protein|nr:hypothetical protein [Streptosporangiaceae bacterium]
MPYAAYLRVYEPLSAFPEPELSRWAAYAASPARPRRLNALEAEHAEALRRAVALPPIIVPEEESEHAYIRWADGVTYICPWQTRLRSWLALGHLRATARPPLADAFSPREAASAARAFARTYADATSLRTYIQTNTWHVPLSWFVLFSPAERWLALGAGDETVVAVSATASAVRTLIYATAMTQARRRAARGLAAVRKGLRGPLAGPDDVRRCSLAVTAQLEDVALWLEEFHPQSVVELDYGGLVNLLDDDALRSDQSVAEISAAISGLSQDEPELAIAMYRRAASRWQALRAAESANLCAGPGAVLARGATPRNPRQLAAVLSDTPAARRA